MIDMNVKYPLWKPYTEKFERLKPAQAYKLLNAVAKRVDSSALTHLKRGLKDAGYTISGPMVKKYSVVSTKINASSVRIRIQGKRVPAYAFKTKPKFRDTTGNKRKQVDVMFNKQLGWHGIKNGFMWESGTGAKLMFERTTAKRFPIKEISYMPISLMVSQDETVKDTIVNGVFDTMVKRFEYELDRRWKQ